MTQIIDCEKTSDLNSLCSQVEQSTVSLSPTTDCKSLVGFSFSIRKYSRWLYQFVSRYEHGIRSNGSPIRVNNTDKLNKAIAESKIKSTKKKLTGFALIPKITEKHLRYHLDKRETFYYISKRGNQDRADRILLMLDIDAHSGQTDSEQVAQWVRANYIPNSYIEPSTNGLGRHLYFILNIESFQTALTTIDLNDSINDIANKISLLVLDEQFQSKVCGIYGLPSIKSKGIISKAGTLAKLPRPTTDIQMNNLIALKDTIYSTLRDIHLAAKELNGRKETTDIETTNNQVTNHWSNVLTTLGNSELDISSNNNGRERKRLVVKLLSSKLLRLPTAQECLSYYLDNELNGKSGTNDNSKRLETFNELINFYAGRFDHDKAKHRPLDKTAVLAQLKSVIPSDQMKVKDRRITYEDMFVFLELVAINQAGNRETSRKSVIAFFKAKIESGEHDRNCGPNKYRMMYNILKTFNLIDCDDSYTRPSPIGKKGIARLIHIGTVLKTSNGE